MLGLPPTPGDAPPDAGPQRLADRVASYERGLIASALAAHGVILKPKYEQLAVSRNTLYEKMQKCGLDKYARFDTPRDDA